MREKSKFLTAFWKNLVMANYEIDAGLLKIRLYLSISASILPIKPEVKDPRL